MRKAQNILVLLALAIPLLASTATAWALGGAVCSPGYIGANDIGYGNGLTLDGLHNFSLSTTRDVFCARSFSSGGSPSYTMAKQEIRYRLRHPTQPLTCQAYWSDDDGDLFLGQVKSDSTVTPADAQEQFDFASFTIPFKPAELGFACSIPPAYGSIGQASILFSVSNWS